MPNYRRTFRPGGTFFLTLVTQDRIPIFAHEPARATLRAALQNSRKHHPFTLDAIVLLRDHLHMILTLPDGDADFSIRISNMKAFFTRNRLATGCPEPNPSLSRILHRTCAIWQRRFWEHTIRDEDDLRRHCDYIHYNPVKHRLAPCPHAWPHSSFQRFVADDRYAPDWCCSCLRPPAKPPDFNDISPNAGE